MYYILLCVLCVCIYKDAMLNSVFNQIPGEF